jgi:hypothetical protein
MLADLSRRAAAAATLLLLALAAPSAPAQTVDDVVRRYLEARGGLARLSRERVGMKSLRDEARPTRGTAALLDWLLFNLALSWLLRGAISAHDWHSSCRKACDFPPGPGCDPPFSPAR